MAFKLGGEKRRDGTHHTRSAMEFKNPIGQKWVADQMKLKKLGVDKGVKLPTSDPPSNKEKK